MCRLFMKRKNSPVPSDGKAPTKKARQLIEPSSRSLEDDNPEVEKGRDASPSDGVLQDDLDEEAAAEPEPLPSSIEFLDSDLLIQDVPRQETSEGETEKQKAAAAAEQQEEEVAHESLPTGTRVA